MTAPSATGTANVINCGPGAPSGKSVCTATYPINTPVVLTAQRTGANFGGWSYNCLDTGTITAEGPNTCTIMFTSTNTNVTVGAIFN